MDRQRREDLKRQLVIREIYRPSDPPQPFANTDRILWELIADLEAAEERKYELESELAEHFEFQILAQNGIREKDEKIAVLREGLMEIRRYCKTEDPNYRRAHDLLELTR